MQQTINCPSCGSPIAGGQKFCGVCGLNLGGMTQQKANACPTCGTPISPGQQFCGLCGTNMASIGQQQPQPAQGGATMPRNAPPATGVTPAVSSAPAPEKQASAKPRKRRILSATAIIFQIFGWIVLVFGVLASLAMAVFAVVGGTFMPAMSGATAFGGLAAIGIAVGGVIASLLYGFAFLAFAEICYAVIDIEKSLAQSK